MPRGIKGLSEPGSSPEDRAIHAGVPRSGIAPRDLWLECPDETRLHALRWAPEERIRGHVLYLHGLGAHGGWGESLGRHLCAHGYDVTAPDMRGHGRTEGAPGQLAVPSVLIGDLCRWIDRMRMVEGDPRTPEGRSGQADRRFVMVGTSLGGCLAAAAGADLEADDLAGVALLSPAFRPIYLPWHEQLSMFAQLVVRREGRVATPLARGLRISSDAEAVRRAGRDPLSLDGLTVRSHWNAGLLIRRARRRLRRLSGPLFVAQGARDPVVDAGTNRRLFEQRTNTRWVWLPDAFHDLPLEPLETWVDGLRTWIDGCLRRPAGDTGNAEDAGGP